MASRDDEGRQLIEMLVMQAAMIMADSLDVEAVVRRAERSLPEPLLRRVRRHQIVTEAGKRTWDEAGREIVLELFQDAGVSLDELGMDIDGLEQPFVLAFYAAVYAKLEQSPEVLKPLRWEHEGAPRSASAAVQVPPRAEARLGHHVLAFDEGRGQIVFVQASAAAELGKAWAWDGAAWAPVSRIPVGLPGEQVQAPHGFYDHARGGVACWTLCHESGSRGSRACGVVVGPEGADPIEAGGDVPVGPTDCSFDIGVVFGHDPARAVTVALGAEAVWELDAGGAWSQRSLVASGRMGRRWVSGQEGAAYDAPGRRVIFWWVDWDDTEYRFWSWDGRALAEVPGDGLPEGLFASHRAAVAAHGAGGVVLHAGAAGMFALRGARWEAVTGGGGPAGLGGPRFRQARAAWDVERGLLMLGPGKYAATADTEAWEQVFYAWSGGLSSRGAWARQGPGRAGPGSARAARLLAAGADGICAVAADWAARRRDEDGAWVPAAPAVPGCSAPIAVTGDPAGALWGVGARGEVARLGAGAWEVLGGASELFGERAGVCVCHDGARLVAWGGEDRGGWRTDTLVFAGDGWTRIGDERAGRPPGWGGPCAPGEVGYQLVYDSYVQRVLRFGRGTVDTLESDGWAPGADAGFESAVDAWDRLVMHDPASGETLAVCLRAQRIARFDLEQSTIVGDMMPPDEHVDLVTRDRDRPLAADWVLDARTRTLRLFVDDALDETYALDLGPVFEHAASRGARARPPDAAGLAGAAAILDAARAAGRRMADRVSRDALEELAGPRGGRSRPSRRQQPDLDESLAEIADSGWEHEGPAVMGAVLADQGLALPEDGFDAASCRRVLVRALRERLAERVRALLGTDEALQPATAPVRWQRIGPLPPARREGAEAPADRPVSVELAGTWRGHVYTASERSWRTYRWDDAASWQAVAHGAPDASRLVAVLSHREDALLAVTEAGAVHELTAAGWARRSVSGPLFGSRRGPCVAYDPHRDRIVVWGGELGGSPSNDTLEMIGPRAGGTWRRVGSADAPRPAGLASGRARLEVRFDLVYDTFLKRFVRFGQGEVAVLDGDTWVPVPMPMLRAVVHAEHRRAVHDADTGETLLVDFAQRRVARFDLGGVRVLAETVWPEGLAAADVSAPVPPFPFSLACPFVPARRWLQTHAREDAWGNYALDLGPLFDLAASLGPRTPYRGA